MSSSQAFSRVNDPTLKGTISFFFSTARLRIDGLVTGSPYIELTDTSNIQSSSGYLSTVRPLLLSCAHHSTIDRKGS